MFLNDFSKKPGSGSPDEFSRYCKNEGLDRIYLLSRLEENEKAGQKISKRADNLWKLLKKAVMVRFY